jgi:NADH:ubiquinone reductase (non-electrogenic)
MIVWSTGIGATPLVQQLGLPTDRAQRLLTNEHFAVDKDETLFAIGDCATREGDQLPATAQVAQQEGHYLAKLLNDRARGKPGRPSSTATSACWPTWANAAPWWTPSMSKGHGFATWMLWRSAYITKLVSFKNKVLVLFDWFKTALFGRDISRF